MLDEHYLAWGASGRNGGGVRQQWSTEMNVRLMQESTELCAHFAEEMGINVWMRRGGYLFLAHTKAAAERLERNVALQNRCDLPTRMIALEEARDLVPELETHHGAGGRRQLDLLAKPGPDEHVDQVVAHLGRAGQHELLASVEDLEVGDHPAAQRPDGADVVGRLA